MPKTKRAGQGPGAPFENPYAESDKLFPPIILPTERPVVRQGRETPEHTRNAIVRAVETLTHERGLSLAQACKMLGLNPRTVSNWIRPKQINSEPFPYTGSTSDALEGNRSR